MQLPPARDGKGLVGGLAVWGALIRGEEKEDITLVLLTEAPDELLPQRLPPSLSKVPTTAVGDIGPLGH